MRFLELIRAVVVGHRELGRVKPGAYRVEPLSEPMRSNPFIFEGQQPVSPSSDVCGFGYWTHVGRDPDGRRRLRYHWIQFNPATGRWR